HAGDTKAAPLTPSNNNAIFALVIPALNFLIIIRGWILLFTKRCNGSFMLPLLLWSCGATTAVPILTAARLTSERPRGRIGSRCAARNWVPAWGPAAALVMCALQGGFCTIAAKPAPAMTQVNPSRTKFFPKFPPVVELPESRW